VEAAKLFDTESWQEVFTLAGLGSGFMGASFSPDGNSILWGKHMETVSVNDNHSLAHGPPVSVDRGWKM